MFGIAKLEKLDTFGSNFMLGRRILVVLFWSFLDEGRKSRFPQMLIPLYILIAMLRRPLVGLSFAVGAGLRPHNFELLIKTRFVDFFLFELIFQGGNIAKRSKCPTLNILQTGLFQIEIALFPKLSLGLTLVELVAGLLQAVQEESTLVDEDGDDFFELLGVFIVELL